MKKAVGLIGLFMMVLASDNLLAQPKQDSLRQSLFKEVAKLDSILFDAFNKRDTTLFKSFFSEDLEFFHDEGGLTGYKHTIDFMREVAKPGNDLRRDLVKGSLEVFPVPGYGAMEIGSHTFCHTENNRQDCGTFKFVHIWQLQNGKWKITRVVSYDH